MLRKSILFLLVVVIFAACDNTGKKNTTEEATETSVETTVLKIADFETKAAELIGQEVKIQGTVDHVCKHGGKKMVLINENGEASVKIYTNDEIGPFDESLAGDVVSVIGTISEFKVDEAYIDEQVDHVKENHEADDPHGIEELASLEEWRTEVLESEKGYLSYYSVDIVNYEVLEEIDVEVEDHDHDGEEAEEVVEETEEEGC